MLWHNYSIIPEGFLRLGEEGDMGCSGSRHLPPSAPHPATIATSSKKFDPYKSSSTYSSRDFKVDEALRDCIVEELCVDTSEPSSSNVKVSSDDSSLPKCQLVHHCKVWFCVYPVIWLSKCLCRLLS